MSESKYEMPLWKCIMLVLFMAIGTGLITYAFLVWQPLPLLIGSIFVAIPVTVVLLALLQKISDIRIERQLYRNRH